MGDAPDRDGTSDVAGGEVNESELPVEIRDNTIFDWVAWDRMFVDARYARSCNESKVARLRKEWEPAAIGAILVSLRPDGRVAIVDGQHRVAAGVEEGMREFPCRVYIDLTIEDEARLYRKFATVNQQTALDKMRARLAEREPVAVQLQAVLNEVDMRISTTGASGNGNVMAVYAIEQLMLAHGVSGLRAILRLAHQAWGHDPRAYTAWHLNGLAMFWARYKGLMDSGRFTETMRATGISALITRANATKEAGYDANGALGRAMLLFYNDRLRTNRLPEWQEKVFSESGIEKIRARKAKNRQAA